MIKTITAYGICVTDDFGENIKGVSRKDLEILQPYEYEKVIGLATCPSAGEMQFVLGFKVLINKNTDLKALDVQWEEVMDKAPPEIKELAYRLKASGNEFLQVDIQFIAGHY